MINSGFPFLPSLSQVVERLLSLPADYWSQFVAASEQPNADHLIIENSNCYATPERSEEWPLPRRTAPSIFPDVRRVVSVSMLGPLTTPEHQFNKTPSSSSLSQRMKSSLTPR